MKLKVGDVVQVGPCGPEDESGWACYCAFCTSSSTRIGVVIHTEEDVGLTLFDFGQWPIHAEDFDPALSGTSGGVAEVISRS